MKVAFFGRGRVLYNSADALFAHGHSIAAIVITNVRPEDSCPESEFQELAKRVGAHFLISRSLESPEVVKATYGCDLGISINWWRVIGDTTVRRFRYGIINAHPGDLPRYRGNAVFNWAILNEEPEVCCTVHAIIGGQLDTGPVICQARKPLDTNTTVADLFAWLEVTAPTLVVRAVEAIASDPSLCDQQRIPESAITGFRCFPRIAEDSFIDWAKTAREVHNTVRASWDPFYPAYTYYLHNNEVKKLYVLETRIIDSRFADCAVPGHIIKNDIFTGESWVACGKGVIALVKCRHEGESEPFHPGQRWRSIRMRLGVNMHDWLWRMQHS